jgi:retron-type reverse transcriptase
MIDLDFQALESSTDIAIALGCSPFWIEMVLKNPSVFYDQIRIPKKGKHNRGKYRIVYKVESELNNLQKNIATAIASRTQFPEYVQGFVSKRSIATNAALHLAQKYVLNVDIQDFFDSITQEQVTQVYRQLGCIESIALVFARLCTFHGRLVQGASTSPMLANLVCVALDRDLAELGKKNDCSYSRYADDITFSGEQSPRKKEVERCLKQHGFQLNLHKWKRQPRGQSQYVTGLTVFDGTRPRIPKDVKRKLRQILHYASKYGLESHLSKIQCHDEYSVPFEIRRIDGLIAFMYSVEPERALQFDIKWQEILKQWKEILKASELLEDEDIDWVSPRNPHAIFARCSSRQVCVAPS